MKKKPKSRKTWTRCGPSSKRRQNVFLTGYEKLTVQQDFELRKIVAGAGAKYKVIKNNIAEKAIRKAPSRPSC
jgi:large subunit ribosomal protein L10